MFLALDDKIGRLENGKTKVEEFQQDYPLQTESSFVVLDQ